MSGEPEGRDAPLVHIDWESLGADQDGSPCGVRAGTDRVAMRNDPALVTCAECRATLEATLTKWRTR